MGDRYALDPDHTDPKRLRAERERARELKKSAWWRAKLAAGLCHYCNQKFDPTQLTMDHVIPLARGGRSTRGNVVPACRACNQTKHLDTPVDQILRELEAKRGSGEPTGNSGTSGDPET